MAREPLAAPLPLYCGSMALKKTAINKKLVCSFSPIVSVQKGLSPMFTFLSCQLVDQITAEGLINHKSRLLLE